MGSKLLMAGKNISNFYCWETTSFNAMKYKLLLNNEYLTFHELCETLLHIKWSVFLKVQYAKIVFFQMIYKQDKMPNDPSWTITDGLNFVCLLIKTNSFSQN